MITDLENYLDLQQELKQLENRISLVSLIQTYNQYSEKRQQLLVTAHVRLHGTRLIARFSTPRTPCNKRWKPFNTTSDSNSSHSSSTNGCPVLRVGWKSIP